jgi:hypothetical protein
VGLVRKTGLEATQVLWRASFARIRGERAQPVLRDHDLSSNLLDGWYEAWPDLFEFDEPAGISTFSIGGYSGPSYDVSWDSERLLYRAAADRAPRLRVVFEGTPQLRERIQRFRDEAADITFGWGSDYGVDDVQDGTSWALHLDQGGRVHESKGSNAYPLEFARLLDELRALVVGLPID